jgi:hypothetical protein
MHELTARVEQITAEHLDAMYSVVLLRQAPGAR